MNNKILDLSEIKIKYGGLWNKQLISFVMDSKDKEFDFSKLNRVDLENLVIMCIAKYRHLKALYEVDEQYLKQK